MKILLLSLGLGFVLSSGAMAHHPLVKIRHADKVLVKTGLSERKVMGAIKCLMLLKKHDTKEEAMEAVMEKIEDHCSKKGLSERKCDRKKHMVGMLIHKCFTKAEFIRDYLGNKAE